MPIKAVSKYFIWTFAWTQFIQTFSSCFIIYLLNKSDLLSHTQYSLHLICLPLISAPDLWPLTQSTVLSRVAHLFCPKGSKPAVLPPRPGETAAKELSWSAGNQPFHSHTVARRRASTSPGHRSQVLQPAFGLVVKGVYGLHSETNQIISEHIIQYSIIQYRT